MLTRLNAIEITFWNRLRKLGIGLLSASAAKDALHLPLERMGYGIVSEVLVRAAEQAQKYPYFLQLIGEALHLAAKAEPERLEPGRCIGESLLKRGLEGSRAARTAYFEDRYRELQIRSLLPAAEAVARLFATRGSPVLSSEFEDVVARTRDSAQETEFERARAGNSALWIQDELRSVGYVWSKIGDAHNVEPGIPSLMNYVAWRASLRQRGEDRNSRDSDTAPQTGWRDEDKLSF